MDFTELTHECLLHVFSQLPARDAARAACVQGQWRDLIHGDAHLWKRFMEADLGLSTKRGADGAEETSFREAYVSWRKAYGPEYWPFLPRAIKAWDQIKDWLTANYPAILATIRPGVSEAEVQAVEADLGFSLCPALKLIYRLHDGQALLFDTKYDSTTAVGSAPAGAAEADADEEMGDEATQTASIFLGLFGGYAVYDHMVVTRLMPLRRAAAWRSAMGLHRARGQLLPFACSYRVHDKMFVVDATSGGLAVMRRRQGGVTPQTAVPSGQEQGARDGVIRWFEEYARRLAGGWYEVASLDPDFPNETRAISLFPLAPPGIVEAVTRGVRVRASVVYAPEAIPDRHMFAYSIRFSLLDSARSPGVDQDATQTRLPIPPPVQRCQLVSRHWVIREEGEEPKEVLGEGVIGKYPILEPGEPEFVYCSCTHQRAARGSMEGDFGFVEGTIKQPSGTSFRVVCPTFQLDVPSFVF